MRKTRLFYLLALLAALALAGCQPVMVPVPPPATAPFTFLPAPTLTPTAAVAPVTVLPLPTAGPTVTPWVYVVQRGDTLIGIAVRLGVNLDELRALNPDVQPQLLQPGQVLDLPAPDEQQATGAFLPPPTPVPLALGAVACFETPVGSRWCFLEARNDGPAPVENPTALVTLVGQDGQALTTRVAYSPLNLIRPGEAAPLAAFFPPGAGPVRGAGAQLLTASSAPDVQARYLPLSLTLTGVEETGDRRTVRGEITLAGERAAPRVRVALVLYNAAGQVVGLREWSAPEALQPGQAMGFELQASALGGEVARFQLLAEAQP